MNYSTILLISLVIASNGAAITYTIGSNQCACDEVLVQADCPYYGCVWTSGACGDIPAVDCTTLGKTVAECNKSGCALNTTPTCESKQACSTYKYDAVASCTLIGCDAGDQDATSKLYPCKDWATTTAFDGTKACSTYSQTDCPKAGCTWSTTNSACQGPVCSDQLSEILCTNIRGADNITTRTICSWDATKTTCGESTTGLVATNCYSYTGTTYYWDASSSTCTECSGSSYSQIIAITFVVILALF